MHTLYLTFITLLDETRVYHTLTILYKV